MDTQTLKTFLTLASLNNFTQTAEVLFVAQSTVTNRIADLEREVGKKLFLRDKKNVSLTKEGQLYLSFAKRILELESQATKELNSFCYANTLRIGSTNTIYECHLYPVIKKLLETQTDTSIKVVLGHTNDLLHKLQDQTIDIVYSYLPFQKAGYECETCYTDELVLVTSSQTNEYVDGIYKDQLPDLKYLMCNFALQEVGIFIQSLFPDYYQFPFEIDNSTKLIQFLKDGVGYSFLPRSLVQNEIDRHTLISIRLLDFETPKIKSYRIYHKHNPTIQKLHLGKELL